MNGTLARSRACFRSTQAKSQGGTKEEWHAQYDKCVLSSCREMCSSNTHCEGVCGSTGKSVWGCWTNPKNTVNQAMANGTASAVKTEVMAKKRRPSLLAGRP